MKIEIETKNKLELELPPMYDIESGGEEEWFIYFNEDMYDGFEPIKDRNEAVLVCWYLFKNQDFFWYEYLRKLGAPDVSNFDIEKYWQ